MIWLLEYADLLAALLGIVGSAIFAWPLIRDASDRQEWETLLRVKPAPDSNDLDDWRKLRDNFIDERLGGYLGYRRTMLNGMGLLFLAFVLILISAAARHAKGSELQEVQRTGSVQLCSPPPRPITNSTCAG